MSRARAYEAGGAAAISVLCEPHWFGGSVEDLRTIRAAVAVPVLAKEFVVEEIQLPHLRAAGADAVLLLAALHPAKRLARFVDRALEIGLEPLVEAHDERELERALASERPAHRSEQPRPPDARRRHGACTAAALARARGSLGRRRVGRPRRRRRFAPGVRSGSTRPSSAKPSFGRRIPRQPSDRSSPLDVPRRIPRTPPPRRWRRSAASRTPRASSPRFGPVPTRSA